MFIERQLELAMLHIVKEKRLTKEIYEASQTSIIIFVDWDGSRAKRLDRIEISEEGHTWNNIKILTTNWSIASTVFFCIWVQIKQPNTTKSYTYNYWAQWPKTTVANIYYYLHSNIFLGNSHSLLRYSSHPSDSCSWCKAWIGIWEIVYLSHLRHFISLSLRSIM